MQQTVDTFSWRQRSRLGGVLRFLWLKTSMLVLWLLAILLGAQALSMLLATVGVTDMVVNGVSLDFGTTLLLLLVLACLYAKSYTTFLLRFGTPRLSVWLGSIGGLFVGGALFLLCSLLLSLLTSGFTLLLSKISADFLVTAPDGSATGGAVILSSLLGRLGELPMTLLWTLEWACLFYLLGCCLRRNKAATLTVCIVGPLVVWLLLLLPTVREAMGVLEGGDASALMMTGMKWLQWFQKAAAFVRTNWQWIQGAAALVSLPLSYRLMRGTPQP